MLHRLCGSPSIPLSFNLAIILPRRITYRVSSGTQVPCNLHTKLSSFRARTTGVSNPVCSPSFRASASVSAQQPAFATGVPPDIYAFHRYTRNSGCLFRTQSMEVSGAVSRLSPEISHLTFLAAYTPFTPSNSEQRLPPPYYRGCWHGVSRGLHRIPSCILLLLTNFTSRKTSSFTRHCWVRLSPIAQNSSLLPPVGVWPVFQCQCGRPPSQVGY